MMGRGEAEGSRSMEHNVKTAMPEGYSRPICTHELKRRESGLRKLRKRGRWEAKGNKGEQIQ